MLKMKYLLLLALVFNSSLTFANDCFFVKHKLAYGFFNGVLTSKPDALKNTEKLKKVLYDQHKISEFEEITLFYNQTLFILDFLEVAKQQVFEVIDIIAKNKTSNNQDIELAETLKLNPQLVNAWFNNDIQNDQFESNATLNKAKQKYLAFRDAKIKLISLSEQDYQKHHRLLQDLLSSHARIVLVAHSQGNLFVNQAFENATEEQQKRLGVIHVGSASLKLHGNYILYENDYVINALGIRNFNAKVTTETKNDIKDRFGHNFIDVYLNERLSTYSLFLKYLNEETDEDKLLPYGIYGRYDFIIKMIPETALTFGVQDKTPKIVNKGEIVFRGIEAQWDDGYNTGKSKSNNELTENNITSFWTSTSYPKGGEDKKPNQTTGDIRADNPYLLIRNWKNKRLDIHGEDVLSCQR